jgi:hypothetical protein
LFEDGDGSVVAGCFDGKCYKRSGHRGAVRG